MSKKDAHMIKFEYAINKEKRSVMTGKSVITDLLFLYLLIRKLVRGFENS